MVPYGDAAAWEGGGGVSHLANLLDLLLQFPLSICHNSALKQNQHKFSSRSICIDATFHPTENLILMVKPENYKKHQKTD